MPPQSDQEISAAPQDGLDNVSDISDGDIPDLPDHQEMEPEEDMSMLNPDSKSLSNSQQRLDRSIFKHRSVMFGK